MAWLATTRRRKFRVSGISTVPCPTSAEYYVTTSPSLVRTFSLHAMTPPLYTSARPNKDSHCFISNTSVNKASRTLAVYVRRRDARNRCLHLSITNTIRSQRERGWDTCLRSILTEAKGFSCVKRSCRSLCFGSRALPCAPCVEQTGHLIQAHLHRSKGGSHSRTCHSRSRRARGGGSHSRTCRSRSRRAWYMPRKQ